MNTGGPRDPTAFMFLMPGVQSVGRWGNVMGGQDFTNDTYVEGVPITNAVVQGEGRNLSFGISVEAIDQFQVETSGTAVMYNGQGASNYVVKSGTNRFRGSGFEFFRNKALDAKSFFAVAKPDDNQHEYGFTLGGPIRRNRMFFFAAYDGYRDRRQTESRLVSIPTAAQRNGDFSALPVVIYDPATTRPNPNGTGFVRDPFPGNIIPAESHLVDLAQLPVVPAGADERRAAEQLSRWVAADRLQQRQHHDEGRSEPLGAAPALGALLARRAPPAHAVSRRGERADGAAAALHGDAAGRGDSDDGAGEAHLRRQLALGESGQPRLCAPLGADLQRHHRRPVSDRGRPARAAGRRGRFAFPEVAFAGPNAPTQWRGTDARAFTEYLDNLTLQDNLQWTRGKHAITFGFQAQRMEARERERTYGSLATFGFSNVQTAGFGPTGTLLTTTGNAYASFLLGDLNATTVIEDSEMATIGTLRDLRVLGAGRLQGDAESVAEPRSALRHHEAVHRVRGSLVVHEPGPAESGGGRISGARCSSPGFGDNSCQCRTPIATYYGNIGPRLGAAYSLNDRTGAARRLRHHVLAARRRRRARRRAQRHRHARLLGERDVPERGRVLARLQLEQRRALVSGAAVLRSRAQHRLRDRSSARAAASPTAIRRSADGRRAIRTGTRACSTR